MHSIVCSSLLALLCATCLVAQEVPATRMPFVVETKTAYLTGYARGDFRLSQAGIERSILQFYTPGRPRHLVVLVEYSRALSNTSRTFGIYESPYFSTLLEIAHVVYGITKRLSLQDSIAVATYDLTLHPITLDEQGKWNFTRNKGQIYGWLEDFLSVGYRMEPAGRDSAPFSTLTQVIEGSSTEKGLRAVLQETERNIAIILIGGGASTFERVGQMETLRLVRNAGIPVFTVQVGFQASFYNEGMQEDFSSDQSRYLGRAWMSEFSRASGGRFVELRHAQEGAGIAERILDQMKQSYVLYFQPLPPKKKFEGLELRLVGPDGVEIKKFYNPVEEKWEGVKVRTREGVQR